jgi:hypothetical protein
MAESEPASSHHKPTFWEETRSPVVRVCHRANLSLILLVLVAAPFVSASRIWTQGLLFGAITVATAVWIVRVIIVREAQVVFSLLGAPVVTLAAYALVRYSLAEVEPVARPDMMLIVAGTIFFFLVLNDIRHRAQITLFVWTLTGLGVVLSLIAAWQLVRGQRPSATFARPADLAAYLLIVFPLVAANFFFSRRSLAEKIGFAFAGLMICAGFAMTQVYWHWLGWLATVLVVTYFVIQKRGWRFRWALLGGCVLVAAVVATLMVTHGLHRTAVTGDEETAVASLNRDLLNGLAGDNARLPIRSPQPLWRTAVNMGLRNLWLGNGPGMFEWLYPSQRSVQARVPRSANEYCNLFAEGGLIGCALVGWVVVSFIIAAVQILRMRAGRYSAGQQSNRFAFTIAGLAMIAGAIVVAVADLNLRIAGISFTLLAIFGAVLTCGVHRRADEQQPTHQPGRYITLRLRGLSRYVLAAGLTLLLVLLAIRLFHSFPAAVLLRRGDRAAQRLDWAAAEQAYQTAWKFDHRSYEVATAFGDLLSARATWNARDRENLANRALSWYGRARTINPYNYDVLIHSARLYDALGQREKADSVAREAVQADPKNASYHAQLGWHYLRCGETELAQKSFRIARQLGALEVLPAPEPAGT